MTRASLSARDRALEEVRDMLRGLAAAISLDLEEQLAALERRLLARIDARRTVRVRIVRHPGARLVARAVTPPKSPADPAHDPDSVPLPTCDGVGAERGRGHPCPSPRRSA